MPVTHPPNAECVQSSKRTLEATLEDLRAAHDIAWACLTHAEYLIQLSSLDNQRWGEVESAVGSLNEAVNSSYILDAVGHKFTFGPAVSFANINGRNAHVAARSLAIRMQGKIETEHWATGNPIALFLKDSLGGLPKYDFDSWHAELDSEYDRARSTLAAEKSRGMAFPTEQTMTTNSLIVGPLAPLPSEDTQGWEDLKEAFADLATYMKKRPDWRLDRCADASYSAGLLVVLRGVGTAMDSLGLKECLGQLRYASGTHQSHAQRFLELGFGAPAEVEKYFREKFITHQAMEPSFFDKMRRFVAQFADELLAKTQPRSNSANEEAEIVIEQNPSNRAKPSCPSRPLVIDEPTFSISWQKGEPLTLGNRKEFHLLAALWASCNQYVPHTELAQQLGGDAFDKLTHIKSRLVKLLRHAGLENLANLIKTQKGHYGLFIS